MAINSVTFIFFDKGRKTNWESSIRIFNVSYEKKNFFEFLIAK